MISVPAMRVNQFGLEFYQASLTARDVQKLVRFETLAHGDAAPDRSRSKAKRRRGSSVNWELLEKRIAASEGAYQRPIIRKKIAELVEYYRRCRDQRQLPAIAGAVIISSEYPLEFRADRGGEVGMLELPEQEGVLRAVDGQHRLLALQQFEQENGLSEFRVPAVIFDRLAADQVVELFVTINAKHTRLNPSHLISLEGRKLYRDEVLAVAHNIVRKLNDRQDSPLHNEIKMLGVGRGKVSQAPLAEEIKIILKSMQALGGRPAANFNESAADFFLAYFKQVARCFSRAWSGRKYSIKTAAALRAFLRVAPEVVYQLRESGAELTDARGIAAIIAPWATRIGDARFETEGEWKRKLAGGTRATADLLARELRDTLRLSAART